MNAISKWGNSLAIRLPKHVAEEAHLSVGTNVDFRVDDGSIVVTPARPRYSLDDLLSKYDPEAHRHQEVDMGGPVGEEEW